MNSISCEDESLFVFGDGRYGVPRGRVNDWLWAYAALSQTGGTWPVAVLLMRLLVDRAHNRPSIARDDEWIDLLRLDTAQYEEAVDRLEKDKFIRVSVIREDGDEKKQFVLAPRPVILVSFPQR